MDDDLTDLRSVLVARAVVGGHSLGGSTAMRFYEKHPTRCHALVLSGTGPGYRNPQAMAGWTARLDGQASELETHGREALLDAHENRLGACPPGAPVRHRVAGLANIARGVMANPPLVDPSTIDIPTLVLVGERDTAFLDSAEFIASRAKAGQKVVIPGAGHACMFKQPKLWNAAVTRFLHSLPDL